jgi:hypothetical protein
MLLLFLYKKNPKKNLREAYLIYLVKKGNEKRTVRIGFLL